MKAQFIEKNDRPEWAVVPYEDYQQLLAAKEMLDDLMAFDAALATDEEEVPHAVVKQLIEGKSPIQVWRKHRGLTQQVLAARAGIAKAYLSQIEGGKRYDVAVMGRRRAHATYFHSHEVDSASALALGMDLTPLMQDQGPKLADFVDELLGSFGDDVRKRLDRSRQVN